MVVATGFFDGVHLGHALVLDTLVSEARRRGTGAVAVTFHPHPRNVLQNGARGLRLLCTQAEKREKVLARGVDSLETVEFTKDFSRLTTLDYFEQYVKGRFGADAVVLGYDNRIGFQSGPTDEVARIAASCGLEVIRTNPVLWKGEEISSSRIRAALEGGLVEDAASMLGYRYTLDGVVVEGDRIGRTIGFPTANMRLYDPLKLIPAGGVYLVKVRALGRDLYGMTNIGTRPTVTGVGLGDNGSSRMLSVETNIFDFDEEIYGLDMRIEFIARIRSERRFPSLDALRSQLDEDRRVCLGMFDIK